ncbi:hypothetical protein V3C99_000355, partial [Haemonchus contortus]
RINGAVHSLPQPIPLAPLGAHLAAAGVHFEWIDDKDLSILLVLTTIHQIYEEGPQILKGDCGPGRVMGCLNGRTDGSSGFVCPVCPCLCRPRCCMLRPRAYLSSSVRVFPVPSVPVCVVHVLHATSTCVSVHVCPRLCPLSVPVPIFVCLSVLVPVSPYLSVRASLCAVCPCPSCRFCSSFCL